MGVSRVSRFDPGAGRACFAIVPRPNEELRESWFEQPPKFSVPPPSLAPPPPLPTTRPLVSSMVGAATGVVASGVALAAAGWIAAHMSRDASTFSSTRTYVLGAIVGGLAGAMLCLAMMRSSRFITRVVFASVVSVALWFCLHVVMLYRHTGTLPLVPMLAAAAIFGACLACVPPFKRARV